MASADTLIIYPTVNGYAGQTTDGSYATIKAGAGEASSYNAAETYTGFYLLAKAAPNTDVYDQMRRGIFTFNTSVIDDTAIISSVTFKMTRQARGTGSGWDANTYISAGSLASNTSIANGDYNGYNSTILAPAVACPAAGNTNFNFTMNASGISYVQQNIGSGQFTIIYFRDSFDVGTQTPTWAGSASTYCVWYSNSSATSSYRPFLEVTYTLPDTTPPASITGLANTTPSCTEINWTWTNPVDADFNHTMIYWNNNFFHNFSNTTTYDLWYGLFGDYEYTFSSKTCDITGNCNTSWVNQTQTTTSCADVTPPASITGLTNDTPTCNSINWSWTNPLDADFNGTMIYNNGVFVHNGTAGSTGSWWGSLSEATSYTFSSHTFDTTGNVNATWVNATATTGVCPDVTPPGSIQGLTNNTTVCESITWDWQGPGDADWNSTIIYRDGVLQYNLSNSTYSDTWSGLTGGVEYLFSALTDDTSGNVNTTWVNMTATPDACAIVPVADFIANDTEVCVDDPVMFNDTSTNTPTYWNWVMSPGGWDSHFESFVHAFDTAGSYNVSLEAGNAAGSDYENKTFFVNVTDCALSADFVANITCQIGKPMAVQFNGTCADPTKSHWEFGEGNDSEEYSPNFTYTEYGSYTVFHSCKDAGGPTIFENKTDYIVVGVNGTVCAANCTGSGSYCSGDSDIEEPFNVMWLVFGLVGGLVLLLIFSRR